MLIDRLSVQPNGRTIKPVTLLRASAITSMRHTHEHRIWVSVVSLLGFGLVSTVFGNEGCLFFGVLAPLFLIVYWIITSLSTLEATTEGVYRRYWHGREQWLAWSDIASVEHNDFTGFITLSDFSRKKIIRFTHNRINVDKFAVMLTVLCPHLWRYETQRTFSIHPLKWLYFLGVLALAFGIVYLVAVESPWIAFTATLILLGGTLWIFWRSPMHVIVHRDCLMVKSPHKTTPYRYSYSFKIALCSGERQDGSVAHTVRVLPDSVGGVKLFLSGYRGGTLPLACTIHRAFLDYKDWPVTIEWVEQPK